MGNLNHQNEETPLHIGLDVAAPDISLKIDATTQINDLWKDTTRLHVQIEEASKDKECPFRTNETFRTNESLPRPQTYQGPQDPPEVEVPTKILEDNDFTKVPVGARLFRFRRAWQGAAHEGFIKKGLGWTWKRRPPRIKRLRQRTSAALNSFLKELRKKRVIEKAKRLRFQSRLFTVPKKGSSIGRLILDLSKLNEYINCPSFKMLTIKEVRLLLPAGFWTISVDLLDGYWHVPIAPNKRPYLGFRYNGQAWQFRAMPFGLNVAPRAFTKLVSHVVREMARAGIWCLPYLDDLLIIAPTREMCLHHTQLALQILIKLGFKINNKKSRLTPSQVFTWLGIDWDLKSHSAQVAQDKVQSLQTSLSFILHSSTCTKRIVMQLQGLANYIGQFDPVIRTLLATTRTILRRFRLTSANDLIQIPRHLKLRLYKWNKIQTIPQRLGSPAPTLTIQTDASLQGWGFQINQQRYHGVFVKSIKLSINTLELLTIWFALLTVNTKNQVIQVLCDNTTAIAALRKGSSPQFRLSSLAELIWRRATRFNWTLTVSHIEGKYNILADQLSRNTTLSSEWSLPPQTFNKILQLNRALQVDLFATHLNNQLPEFLAPCPDQKAAAIDALTTPWDTWKHLYLYPPTPLISKALAKLIRTPFTSAILVTPEAPTRPWYMALQLRKVPSVLLETQLTQIVVNKVVTAPQLTKLRVWKFSSTLITQDFRTAIK